MSVFSGAVGLKIGQFNHDETLPLWRRADLRVRRIRTNRDTVGTEADPTLVMKLHMSATAGRERPVKSNEKLMNVEHRTSNIVFCLF